MFTYIFHDIVFTTTDIRSAYKNMIYHILITDYHMYQHMALEGADYVVENIYPIVSSLIIPQNIENNLHEFFWKTNDDAFEIFNQTVIQFGLDYMERRQLRLERGGR